MNWFYNWLRNRALRIPRDRNSGGDWLRLYKVEIFAWLDKLAIRLAGQLPPSKVLSNDIVKNLPVPDAIRRLMSMFLVGVMESAYAISEGQVDKVIDYLKEQVMVAP